ncbi:sensor histidine kinase [Kitasatospora griseola]|uniref:sensor histidine kinase n=1 Tax=Kitasatospora griseola TaxID=2064 RepID=UPI001670E205|nr:sensor histidine kinase [Kitasatospora griseola]GGQ91907.1 ATPase [Kitasatospora griseola]
MLRPGSSPGTRLPAAVLVGLLPAVVIGVTVALAKTAGPGQSISGILLCGLVGTLTVAAVGFAAAHRGGALEQALADGARQGEELRARLARQQAGMLDLAKNELPEAVDRLQRGEFITDVLRSYEQRHLAEAGEDFHEARHAVLRAVLDAVDNEEAMRESAQRAFVNIARRVQAIVHRQALDLRQMEERHGDLPAVFDDLLILDHGNALIGRLADSIAVLGGARPGRQWSRPVPLFSVLRGGISRILDFRRVELHPVSEVAVVGPAVEPLIHALAELLDNATRYSPPQTDVHLTAVEVQTGIAIEIEDGGLSLGEEGRARAERMLEEAQSGIDLNDLGETPRLGLAVVGRLARAYGFQVSLRPSAYGGVRAVLIVPQRYITTAPAPSRAHGIGRMATGHPSVIQQHPKHPENPVWSPPAEQPTATHTPSGGFAAAAAFPPAESRPRVPAPSPAEDDYPVVTERTANGLPQRRRHAAPLRPGGSAPRRQAPAPAAEPVQPGLWLAAFTDGVNGSTPSDPSDGRHASEESAGKGEK